MKKLDPYFLKMTLDFNVGYYDKDDLYDFECGTS